MIKHKFSILFLIFAVLGMCASGCKASSEPTVTATTPAATAVSEEQAAEAGEEASATKSTTVEMEEAETDQCLACHTDQQKLMEVADPVVETESENEGEG